jgi:hypothetical protein
MEDWTYRERKIMRIYIWVIFIFGNIMILTMLGVLSGGLITSYDVIMALLIVGTASILWNLFYVYCLANSPLTVVLNDRMMQVNWSRRTWKEYPWQNITLKKNGLPEFVLIIIRDPAWPVPRWVILDGSSKQYRELISRIKNIKHLTEIE